MGSGVRWDGEGGRGLVGRGGGLGLYRGQWGATEVFEQGSDLLRVVSCVEAGGGCRWPRGRGRRKRGGASGGSTGTRRGGAVLLSVGPLGSFSGQEALRLMPRPPLRSPRSLLPVLPPPTAQPLPGCSAGAEAARPPPGRHRVSPAWMEGLP